MAVIRNFLRAEREQGGWRFWLLWIVATNVAFFAGIALAGYLRCVLDSGLTLPAREALASAGTGILLAALQTPLLRRHLPGLRGWALSNVLGWPLGVLAGATLVERVAPGQPITSLLYLVVVAAVIGAVLGIIQTFILRRVLPGVGAWWVGFSVFAWAVQFPGIVTGAVLARLLPSEGPPD